jgi:signal transduction histidine kinase
LKRRLRLPVAGRRRPASIHLRLTVILLTSVLALWALTSAITFVYFRMAVGDFFDGVLRYGAQLTLAQARSTLLEGGATGGVPALRDLLARQPDIAYQDRIAFRVFGADGAQVAASPNAEEAPLAPLERGFQERRHAGRHWRVYTRVDESSGLAVQTAAPLQERTALAAAVAQGTLLPAILVAPLLGLLIWAGVGQGLAPLQRVATAVAARRADDLDPVDDSDAPGEVRPLLNALNALLSRVKGVLDQERRFTAHAAHELRTPLTRLRLQAQLASRAHQSAERDAALRMLIELVDQATDLVRQLLTLARLDPGGPTGPREPIELGALVHRVAEEIEPLVAARRISLTLPDAAGPAINGNPAELVVLIRNLLENAVKYTPTGGAVSAAVSERPGAVELHVSDTGPGIPEHEQEKVFERFYRAPGAEVSGSGLGLAIVREVVARHGASIRLGNRAQGGLDVVVQFDRAE